MVHISVSDMRKRPVYNVLVRWFSGTDICFRKRPVYNILVRWFSGVDICQT